LYQLRFVTPQVSFWDACQAPLGLFIRSFCIDACFSSIEAIPFKVNFLKGRSQANNSQNHGFLHEVHPQEG
jgi:hypothetical protein